jgi:hypothetical protein
VPHPAAANSPLARGVRARLLRIDLIEGHCSRCRMRGRRDAAGREVLPLSTEGRSRRADGQWRLGTIGQPDGSVSAAPLRTLDSDLPPRTVGRSRRKGAANRGVRTPKA